MFISREAWRSAWCQRNVSRERREMVEQRAARMQRLASIPEVP